MDKYAKNQLATISVESSVTQTALGPFVHLLLIAIFLLHFDQLLYGSLFVTVPCSCACAVGSLHKQHILSHDKFFDNFEHTNVVQLDKNVALQTNDVQDDFFHQLECFQLSWVEVCYLSRDGLDDVVQEGLNFEDFLYV